MKFIHCADLHLASEMESRLSPEKAKMRRYELLDTFRRLADYAVGNGVDAVLICGDIFDESKPRRSDKKGFIDIVRNHPETDFLCLAGNHDESLSEEDGIPDNLRTFNENWTKYTYGNTEIHGCEQTETNCNLLYTSLRTNPSKVNIVMLHGQIRTSNSKPVYGDVILPALADKGIDYLALGHIHSYTTGELDRRGVWCYSGCPEGRGYDECGEKGFVLINTENEKLSFSFIPFAYRRIEEIRVDLTGLDGGYAIEEKVLSALEKTEKKNMVRVLLCGRLPVDVQVPVSETENRLNGIFFSASVKNMTGTVIDAGCYSDELSLRGEFIRTVMNEPGLSEEEKEMILRCGLLALNGEEVDFD